MTFTDEQIKSLRAPLNPCHVKPPPRGKYGEYIEGHHAISEANRIFNFDGWSYVITSLVQCSRTEAKDSNGQPQVRVGYRCTVKVTVGGVEREGAAVGSGMSKPENEHDAHESAVKEAETDALKRALRTFGNTFGLALYDKTKADVQAPQPELVNEGHLKALRETMRKVGVSEEKACQNLGIAKLEAATVEQYEVAITQMNAVIAQQSKQKEAA